MLLIVYSFIGAAVITVAAAANAFVDFGSDPDESTNESAKVQ